MKKQSGKFSLVILAAVLGLVCAQLGFAQTFKSVTNSEGALMAQVSAGGSSVWAIDAFGANYIYSGPESEFLIQVSPAQFVQIAAGGGNQFQSQPDAVWALDTSHNIYTLTDSGFVQVSGALVQITVGPGYQDSCHPYEVWGINLTNEVFRYDYCSGQFNQEPNTTLAQIAAGGAGVWGLATKTGQIFELDFASHAFNKVTGKFGQIAVGNNGVWGIDGSGNVHQWNTVTQKFAIMPGISLTQISAGGNGVWGLTSSGQIFRLDASSQTFVQIPGTLVTISAGTGGGVWGINSSGAVFAFSTP